MKKEIPNKNFKRRNTVNYISTVPEGQCETCVNNKEGFCVLAHKPARRVIECPMQAFFTPIEKDMKRKNRRETKRAHSKYRAMETD